MEGVSRGCGFGLAVLLVLRVLRVLRMLRASCPSRASCFVSFELSRTSRLSFVG